MRKIDRFWEAPPEIPRKARTPPGSHKHIQVNKTHKASEGNPHELGEESAEESAERSMQRDNPPKSNTPWAPSGPERIKARAARVPLRAKVGEVSLQ